MVAYHRPLVRLLVVAFMHFRFLAFLFAAMGGFLLSAQLNASPLGMTQLGAPVKDFCLPVFGENGYKVWDLSGHEGHYLSSECLLVKTMQLRTFSGEERLQLEAILESPLAKIHLGESLAESEALIHIQGPGYTGEGQGWTWQGKTHTLFLKSHVRVVFRNTAFKNSSPHPS